MGKELLLAIDIGTTNSKGALFNRKGEEVASASMRHQVSHPQPGGRSMMPNRYGGKNSWRYAEPYLAMLRYQPEILFLWVSAP